jgi:hypothetical protein
MMPPSLIGLATEGSGPTAPPPAPAKSVNGSPITDPAAQGVSAL